MYLRKRKKKHVKKGSINRNCRFRIFKLCMVIRITILLNKIKEKLTKKVQPI